MNKKNIIIIIVILIVIAAALIFLALSREPEFTIDDPFLEQIIEEGAMIDSQLNAIDEELRLIDEEFGAIEEEIGGSMQMFESEVREIEESL